MNIDNAYPSKYLQASDLGGARHTVTMRSLELEMLKSRKGADEQKPILYFERAQKGLVLNVTNKNAIKTAYGVETDGWMGKIIILYTARVEAFGEMTDAIRVDVPQGVVESAPPALPASAPNLSPQQSTPTLPPAPTAPLGDDDIPF